MPTTKCVHNWRWSSTGRVWMQVWFDPPLSANTTSSPLAPRQQQKKKTKTCLSRVLMILNAAHLIHPHRYSQWGNNFITPARTVQSWNRGASSVVTTVELSSRDASHLHQRREAADNVMRQLRPPWVWAELLLYTLRCVETWRARGLGDCVVWNTNRRATLNPWRRGLQLTGKEAVTQPNCCTEICIPAIYTTQNVGWKVLQLLARFSWVNAIEWGEREREMTKIISKTRSQCSNSRSSSSFNARMLYVGKKTYGISESAKTMFFSFFFFVVVGVKCLPQN